MTSRISETAKIKELLWNALPDVKELGTMLRALESISNERVPRAENLAFQDELNRTHATYMQCINKRVTYINEQIVIIKDVKALLTSDNVGQTELLEITSRFHLMRTQLQRNNAECAMLENRITELQSERNV